MRINSMTRIINGIWYEVCVQKAGVIRDVIVESSLRNAVRRSKSLANQWPECELIFIRRHRDDKKRGAGASTFVVLHKLSLNFRIPRDNQ